MFIAKNLANHWFSFKCRLINVRFGFALVDQSKMVKVCTGQKYCWRGKKLNPSEFSLNIKLETIRKLFFSAKTFRFGIFEIPSVEQQQQQQEASVERKVFFRIF